MAASYRHVDSEVFHVTERQQIIPVSSYPILDVSKYDVSKKIKDLGKDICWETVKEVVIKEIPIYGKIFSVIDNINSKKQIENIIKGLQYIWKNFEMLNEELNDKLDKEFVSEDNLEFVLLAKRVFEDITKQYKEEKIRYLANFIANSSTKEYSKTHHKEGILDKITRYSVEHVLILKFFCDSNIFEENSDLEKRRENLKENSVDIDTLQVDGLNKDIIRVCVRDLESDGFIDEIAGGYWGNNGGKYYLTNYGLTCIKLLEDIE